MFRKHNKEEKAASEEENAEDLSAPPLKPFSKRGAHSYSPVPARTESPRRMPEISGGGARRIDHPRASGNVDDKKLIVGRDIRLTGEITSCDKLVVEGQVEASLNDARVIEVSRSGVFKGNATVHEADISGHFDGELTAREKLVVRGTGRISGSIRYGQIVIESGGEISGDMRTLTEREIAETAPESENEAPVGDSPELGNGSE